MDREVKHNPRPDESALLTYINLKLAALGQPTRASQRCVLHAGRGSAATEPLPKGPVALRAALPGRRTGTVIPRCFPCRCVPRKSSETAGEHLAAGSSGHWARAVVTSNSRLFRGAASEPLEYALARGKADSATGGVATVQTFKGLEDSKSGFGVKPCTVVYPKTSVR